MKNILFAIILLGAFSCKNKESMPLFDAKPVGMEQATEKDFGHCIDIRGEGYLLQINGTTRNLPDLDSLQSVLKTERADIAKQTLNIITGRSNTYKKTVDVLDLLTIEKIKDFKVLTDGSENR